MGAQSNVKTTGRSASVTPKLTVVPAATVTGQVLDIVKRSGARGATAAEISTALSMHRGRVSRPLSTKHRDGVLARLAIKRDGVQVYVMPTQIRRRPTEAYRPNKQAKDRALAILKDELAITINAATDSRGKVSAQHILDAMDDIVT